MREGLTSRLWLALVILAFCAPLFIGLGRTDLENDEAIYSYAVDSILARGDWLDPLLSPSDQTVFLEKPPLKFWIVAAPIAAGLLPHDEAGMRVWDALFGALAFGYVFLIGRRLAGPLCGFVAVFVLFVYGPLLFIHGLRNNNMESPLFLCYCGGVFHYLQWASAPTASGRRRHPVAVTLYFFLGFMTKFVAAFFLPVLLGAATLLSAPVRRQALREWRVWALMALLFFVLAAPWFAYQHWREGAGFWRVLVAEHVYARFTAGLDPGHIHPWYFYFTTMVDELALSKTVWLVAAGSVLLLVRTVREPTIDRLLVVSWFACPLALMSIGTSKLHHYLYPFLPPAALAAGCLVGWGARALSPLVDRAAHVADVRTAAIAGRPRLRRLFLTISAVAFAIAVVTFVAGPLRLRIGGVDVFRNSLIVRPLLVSLLFAVAAGRAVLAMRAVLLIVALVVLLPMPVYRATLSNLAVERHPLRSTGACLTRVAAAEGGLGHPTGIYSVGEQVWFLHSYYYYFRHAGPWTRTEKADARELLDAVFTPGRQRPVIIDQRRFRTLKAEHEDEMLSVAAVPLGLALLILPGPYVACVPSFDLSEGLR